MESQPDEGHRERSDEISDEIPVEQRHRSAAIPGEDANQNKAVLETDIGNNNNSADSDESESSPNASTKIRRSTRERKQTEKGLEYSLELKKSIVQRLKRQLITKLSSLGIEENLLDEACLRSEIIQIENIVSEYRQAVDELLRLLIPDQRENYIRDLQDVLDDWNQRKKAITQRINSVEIDNIWFNRPPSVPEDRRSRVSSVRSTTSSVQEKKLNARAKVAALRSKMLIEDEMIQQKSLLARHEAQLQKLKIKQQLAEAEAEAEVYEDV